MRPAKDPGPVAQRSQPGRRRLGDADRASLAVWGATRLGMIVLAWISAWLFATGPDTPGAWLARWDRWDEGIFVDLARHGYFGPGTDPMHVAFFPGFPVAMWVTHLVVWDWVAAGLVVSVAAGAVATVALGRLAADEVEGAWLRRSSGIGKANGVLRLPRTRRDLNGAEAASASVGLVLSTGKGAVGKTGEGLGTSADLVEAMAGDRRAADSALVIDDGSAASPLVIEGGSAASGSAIGGSSAAPASDIDRDPAAPALAPAAHGALDPTIPRAVRIRATQAAADASLFFALAPAAVFLAAGYSESLFAAFAFSAWAAARRDRWGLAVVLAAGASAVRVNGLFLAAAIALEFVLAGRSRRRWVQAPLLAVPVVPVAGYVAYLRYETGDWFAWQHAQAAGWFRTFRDPKYAWDQTWRAAFGASQAGHTAWVFQLELVAVVVGLALTALLLLKRRFPEALYVALSLLALGTSTWFMSVPRTMLLWWPLWTMLGAWAARRPMVRTLYVCCVAPVMVGVALLFLSGQWAG